jgi:hypothetical protein
MAEVKQRKNKNYILYSIGLTVGIIVYFTFQIQGCKISAKEKKYDLTYPKELIKLAESVGIEPIGGEKFLNNLKMYSGQGLPYAFNVLAKPEEGQVKIPASVIFWCQKGEKKYLLYAVDNQKKERHYDYEIKSVISTSDLFGHDYNIEFSYGMVVYDGTLGTTRDLSHFSYLDNPNEHGPKDIYPIRLNGFLPIIMYQDSSLTVLYFYNNRWLQYVEVDV